MSTFEVRVTENLFKAHMELADKLKKALQVKTGDKDLRIHIYDKIGFYEGSDIIMETTEVEGFRPLTYKVGKDFRGNTHYGFLSITLQASKPTLHECRKYLEVNIESDGIGYLY